MFGIFKKYEPSPEVKELLSVAKETAQRSMDEYVISFKVMGGCYAVDMPPEYEIWHVSGENDLFLLDEKERIWFSQNLHRFVYDKQERIKREKRRAFIDWSLSRDKGNSSDQSITP